MALFNTPDYSHIIWAPQQWPEGESGVSGLMSGLGAGMGGGGGGGMGGFAGMMGGGKSSGGGGGGSAPAPSFAPANVPSATPSSPAVSTANWGNIAPSKSGGGMGPAINNYIDSILSKLR